VARRKTYPETPDGRFFVARGRLWRKTDPRLDDSARRAAVKALMQARRAVFQAGDDQEAVARARAEVDAAKRSLGERGPVWWEDDAPDETRRAPWNSSYAHWWEGLSDEARAEGLGDNKR
jgi:hypothetical protein